MSAGMRPARALPAGRPAVLPAVLLALSLAGCEKGVHNMYVQPRDDTLGPSALWNDGGAARLPVAGTVISARGGFAESSSGRAGYTQAQRWDRDEYAAGDPYPLTATLLERGRQRFDIFCAPCHGVIGDGDGYIVRRGFPAPPSYQLARLRAAPDRYFFDVMTNGYGLMYAYADRVPPADRWAIVAYIRALQLSQRASAALLSASDRAHLAEGKAPEAPAARAAP